MNSHEQIISQQWVVPVQYLTRHSIILEGSKSLNIFSTENDPDTFPIEYTPVYFSTRNNKLNYVTGIEKTGTSHEITLEAFNNNNNTSNTLTFKDCNIKKNCYIKIGEINSIYNIKIILVIPQNSNEPLLPKNGNKISLAKKQRHMAFGNNKKEIVLNYFKSKEEDICCLLELARNNNHFSGQAPDGTITFYIDISEYSSLINNAEFTFTTKKKDIIL